MTFDQKALKLMIKPDMMRKNSNFLLIHFHSMETGQDLFQWDKDKSFRLGIT